MVATRGREEFEIAGPLESADKALEVLPQAWLYFWKLDPRNPYRWVVAKWLAGPPYPPGLLNERLKVETAAMDAV